MDIRAYVYLVYVFILFPYFLILCMLYGHVCNIISCTMYMCAIFSYACTQTYVYILNYYMCAIIFVENLGRQSEISKLLVKQCKQTELLVIGITRDASDQKFNFIKKVKIHKNNM